MDANSGGGARRAQGSRRADRTRWRDRDPLAHRKRGKSDVAARRRAQRARLSEAPKRPAPGEPQAPSAPPLPADIDPRVLDRKVREQLRPLARGVADQVARRLVAAAELLDVEPEAALAHALVARRLAPRMSFVREAVGLAAYRAGQWRTSIAELRAYHRMSGRQTHLAILADCERALGRPERAIDIFRAADRERMAPAEMAELLIVAAAARADMGEPEAAVAMLQVPELERDEPWVARLRYAYADALLKVGRRELAREWFSRAVDVDEDVTTDAAERLLELDGVVIEEWSADTVETRGTDDAGDTGDTDEPSQPREVDAREVDTDQHADQHGLGTGDGGDSGVQTR